MTPQELRQLVDDDRQRGVILDANLLILLWIGRWRKSAITRHKRTAAFDSTDYELLETLLQQFSQVVVTPCILAEASNLVRQSGMRREITESVLDHFEILDEHHLPSIQVVQNLAFAQLGLTDAGILELAKDRWLVVTVDVDLMLVLLAEGLQALNFNHLRFS